MEHIDAVVDIETGQCVISVEFILDTVTNSSSCIHGAIGALNRYKLLNFCESAILCDHPILLVCRANVVRVQCLKSNPLWPTVAINTEGPHCIKLYICTLEHK